MKPNIPHTPPFLLVDRIDHVTNEGCVGYKFIGSNEPFFAGHFPGNPIMPGVLQVEAMAQTACAFMAESVKASGKVAPMRVLLCSIDSAKFKKPVLPGSTLEMHVSLRRKIGNIVVFTGKALVDGNLVSEAEFKAAFVETERTLGIIKPDAVKKNYVTDILNLIDLNGLKVASRLSGDHIVPMMQRIKLSYQDACKFYEVHSGRGFYKDLCEFMSSGECVAMVLEGDDAVMRYRSLMGATDPVQSDKGTIRKLYATSIDENAVHGSDSLANAHIEIEFFFGKNGLIQA